MRAQLIKTIPFILLCLLAELSWSQGNVGIGTAIPTGKLHIDLNGTANTLAIIIDDDDNPSIRLRQGGISRGFLMTTPDEFKLGTYSSNPTGKLVFHTAGSDRMFLTPDGDLGFGIDNPVSKFQIVGGSDVSLTSNGYLMLGSAGGASLAFDNNEIMARNDSATADLFIQAEGGATQFGDESESNIEIENSSIQAYYNGSAETLILQGAAGGKTRLGNGFDFANTKLHISTGTDADLDAASSGYLMMGLSSGINIVADNNEIQARNSGAASHLYLQNKGGNVFIGDATNFTGSHRLGVDGNAVILGAVRIGNTATPAGYKLAVDGKAIVTELLVRLVPNWPDYVFDKNYKLPGLNEVEDFIKKNNHLPGIPSAKTLEVNGLNVGEMQKLQMEKIEELTLYIIGLKKEIEILKQQK